MRRTVSFFVMGILLAACDVTTVTPSQPAPDSARQPTAGGGIAWQIPPEQAARMFTEVVRRVEPVAERECQRQAGGGNCDFLIVVDPNPRAQPNAYQSEDERGRPVLTFTVALIASVDNADQLAFVMGHEAAHHISSHLARQRRNAANAAEIFGGLATLTGGGSGDVATAQRLGAAVGARVYSKEFELEADRLGTIITYRAGYDPLRGAEFFSRIPDPGDRFLGSHPPNAARVETVRSTLRSIGG